MNKMFHGLDLTRDQITKYNVNHRLAVKYFESIGLLPKDRKPYSYSLHHKDENLRHTDIERYIEWRIEDLIVVESSKHMKEHMIGNTSHLGFKATDEQRQKMSNSQKGNKNASGKRTEEQRRRMSEAQPRRFANGAVPWNKGLKFTKEA